MIQVQHPTPVPPMLEAEYRANPTPADPDAAWGAFQGKGELRAALEPVQHGICAYCEESLLTWGYHIDHMIRALHLSCRRLNRRRRDWLAAITRDLAGMAHDREATVFYLRYCLGHGQPFVTVVQEYFGWI